MNIDKSNFQITTDQIRVEKPWGYEIIFSNPKSSICGKVLHINAGARLSLQYHEEKEESLALLNGRANIIIENEYSELIEEEMQPLRGYFIHNGQQHRFQGITDCDIMEVSTPEKGTTVRVQDDYARKNETEEVRAKERGGM